VKGRVHPDGFTLKGETGVQQVHPKGDRLQVKGRSFDRLRMSGKAGWIPDQVGKDTDPHGFFAALRQAQDKRSE